MKKLLLIIFGAIAFSCNEDPSPTTGNAVRDANVRLSVCPFSEIDTRATDETAIHDLYVFQYVDNVLTVRTKLDTEALARMFTGFALSLDEMDGTQDVVFFFANIEHIGGEALLTATDINTVEGLRNHTLSFNAGTDFDNYLPMRGEYRGVIAEEVSPIPPILIEMTRMVSRINFNFDATALNQFVASSVRLMQVPQVISLPRNSYEPSLPDGTGPDGGTTIATLPDFTAFPSGTDTHKNLDPVAIPSDSTEIGVFTWYVAENARGSWTGITHNREKNPLDGPYLDPTFIAQAPYSSYILLEGTYVGTGEPIGISYRIYLGGNAFGDMNLIGNTTYNVTTTITGTNTADTRINLL